MVLVSGRHTPPSLTRDRGQVYLCGRILRTVCRSHGFGVVVRTKRPMGMRFLDWGAGKPGEGMDAAAGAHIRIWKRDKEKIKPPGGGFWRDFGIRDRTCGFRVALVLRNRKSPEHGGSGLLELPFFKVANRTVRFQHLGFHKCSRVRGVIKGGGSAAPTT